ncbi:MAG: hypothetical protein EBS53_19145, partial [Bacteroidetes bacterium]|nr:hypothetical protein [Bacteroidota bacterium]
DIDHAGFFSDRFDFGGLGTQLVTAQVVGLGPFTNQRPVDLGTITPGATSFVAGDVGRADFATGRSTSASSIRCRIPSTQQRY